MHGGVLCLRTFPQHRHTAIISMMKAILVLAWFQFAQSQHFCGECINSGEAPMKNTFMVLQCMDASAKFVSIDFASYGTPQGQCGKWKKGDCHSVNSTEVMKDVCIGQNSCILFPDTDTFGDPCFDTEKHLVVQAQCSTGTGTAKCSLIPARAPSRPPAPTPSPPPVPTSGVQVTAQWANRLKTVSTHVSLQVVSHAYLARDSPIHDSSFALLKQLRAHHPRYVPWFPMPEYGICELTAPTGVGTPQCKSSWNCTLPDQMMADFWSAVDGDSAEAIPNFSTQPPWLYPAGKPVDLKALGDYYGRLLAWYTKGGMIDECGVQRLSGHHYNITIWEVFNEPIAEHRHTKESYVAEFDAIVQGIRRWADPEHRIKFVGMNLANIRAAPEVEDWATYFLTPENHAEDCRDALDYIGYHSYPTNGGYNTDPASLLHLFEYYDAFIDKVNQTNAIAQKISPSTRTMLDECGTVRLPVLFNPSDPKSGPFYWVASAAGFVYLYLRVAALAGDPVHVVGMSQFMDDVKREPGVSMIDWTNGRGTARYWALKLLRDACEPGDIFVHTDILPAGEVYAQGIVASDTKNRRIVVVNKRYKEVTFTVAGVKLCYALVVDTMSGEGPPRKVECEQGGVISLGPFASAVIYDCGISSLCRQVTDVVQSDTLLV